jgi:hypothetical protein
MASVRGIGVAVITIHAGELLLLPKVLLFVPRQNGAVHLQWTTQVFKHNRIFNQCMGTNYN